MYSNNRAGGGIMNRTSASTLYLAVAGAVILTLCGCGGPFLKGPLMIDEPEYYGYITAADSLELSLIRPGQPTLTGRVPIKLDLRSHDPVTYKYREKELKDALHCGGDLVDDNTLRIEFEKYIDAVLVIRDRFAQKEIDRKELGDEIGKLDCDRLRELYPDMIGNDKLEFVKQYKKLSICRELSLHDSKKARSEFSLKIAFTETDNDVINCQREGSIRRPEITD
jgi:hypothetical protein